jgi:signal transduction histidine kinase
LSALDLIAVVARILLALVAILALVEFARHRDRPRLETAIMLACLGIPVAAALLPEDFERPFWLTLATPLLVIAQPYMAMRLVTFFRPVPRPYMWAAAAGLVFFSIVFLVDRPPLAEPVVVAIVAYLVICSMYAALAFLRGMRGSGGAFRVRLGAAAFGSAMLATTLFFAAVAIAVPGIRPFSSAVFPLAIGVGFYLAFVPPRWVRQAWQLPELHRFLQLSAATTPLDRLAHAGHDLCETTTRLTGGTASAVLRWDAVRSGFAVESTDADPGALDIKTWPSRSVVGRVWQSRIGELVPTEELVPEAQAVAAKLDARAMLAVPIVSGDRARGVLVAFRAQGRLFTEDLLDLMSLLASQYAVTWENAELLREQHRLVADLQRTNQEMEAFSYSVSHDLRRPLRGIDGFSDALLEDYRDKLDAQGVDYLTRVRNAAQSMGRLIDDLLKLTRLSKDELRPRLLDLSAIASAIIEELQEAEPERRVRVVIHDGIEGYGDPAYIRLVLQNLLENAWKFTANRETPCIQFGETTFEGEHAYFVKDDGAGFESEYAGKLFQPFQRLHSVQEFPGTGIGLTTVQWIIRRHGGRVWAEGAVEQGATFFFTLSSGGGIDERASRSQPAGHSAG